MDFVENLFRDKKIFFKAKKFRPMHKDWKQNVIQDTLLAVNPGKILPMKRKCHASGYCRLVFLQICNKIWMKFIKWFIKISSDFNDIFSRKKLRILMALFYKSCIWFYWLHFPGEASTAHALESLGKFVTVAAKGEHFLYFIEKNYYFAVINVSDWLFIIVSWWLSDRIVFV